MNLFEIDEKAEIKRNVNFLISTYKFTCPMARNFGLSASFIDNPSKQQAESLIRDEIENTLKIYEPRADIDEIIFTYENNKIIPLLKLKGID